MVWQVCKMNVTIDLSIYLSVGRSGVSTISGVGIGVFVWYDAVVVRAGRIGGGFFLLGCLFA